MRIAASQTEMRLQIDLTCGCEISRGVPRLGFTRSSLGLETFAMCYQPSTTATMHQKKFPSVPITFLLFPCHPPNQLSATLRPLRTSGILGVHPTLRKSTMTLPHALILIPSRQNFPHPYALKHSHRTHPRHHHQRSSAPFNLRQQQLQYPDLPRPSHRQQCSRHRQRRCDEPSTLNHDFAAFHHSP